MRNRHFARRAAAVFSVPGFAAAAGAEPAVFTPPPAGPSVIFSLLRLGGALALVLAVFFAGLWLFRNWERLTARGRRAAPRLRVLEARSLGARNAVYVVGYERQRFLLAAAPGGVSLLAALPEAAAEEPAAAAPPSFADALARALSPLGSRNGAAR